MQTENSDPTAECTLIVKANLSYLNPFNPIPFYYPLSSPKEDIDVMFPRFLVYIYIYMRKYGVTTN